MRKLALIATFCLICVADTAWALGLGGIEVFSSLNQPLRAEIPLFAVKPGEQAEITAELASADAFARMGRERNDILNDLRFRVVNGPTPDQAILQVTTAQSVREPFISMLVEISWSEGRLVREFTILLDPPVLQSSQSARRPASDFEGPSSSDNFGQTFAYDQPQRSTTGGSYGPVRAQETLWSIAYAQRPNDSISMEQMMQAIYEANPDAFDGSISSIRAGSMLRIPNESEIRATNPAQARREVANEQRATRTAPAPVESAPVAAAPSATPAAEPQGELRLSQPADTGPTPSEPASTQTPVAPVGEDDSASTAPPTTEVTQPVQSAARIEIRDNSAKALELLSEHAREHSAQQLASERLTAETSQATTSSSASAEAAPATHAAEPAEQTVAPVTETESPPPVPAEQAPEAAADSPFVDEPSPDVEQPPAASAEPAAETPAAQDSPTTSDDVSSDDSKPAAPPVDAIDDSLPPVVDDASAFNPLLLGAGAAAVLLLALGAARLRKYRAARSTVQLAPIVLADVESGAEPPFRDTRRVTSTATGSQMTDTLKASGEPQVARTVESTMRGTLPPEQTTQRFMAVSTPQLPPDMPVAVDDSSTIENDPYADALGEVDIHIAYGLYDEAARLLQEPLSKSPERKDLHLKLMEVYFSANMTKEFEVQARKMKAVVSGTNDPDWEKACIMGQQLCPESDLFGVGGSAAGSTAGVGATADLDISSMLADAKLGATSAATPVTPAPPTHAAPGTATDSAPASLDLDLSGFDLEADVSRADQAPAAASTATKPAKPADSTPPPATKPAPKDESSNTLDFNLEGFNLDTTPAETASPAKTTARADDDSALDIDLTDFDMGTPAEGVSDAPADTTQSAEQDSDDLLPSELEAGEGETDTRLDLARAYIDMGEPEMAQALLQEVIAQGDGAQKQEAQELLGRLSAT